MANLVALRAPVFSLSAKNLRGGAEINPPAGARVNCYVNRDEVVNKYVLFKTTIHVLVIPSVRKIGISRPADGSAGADGPGGTDAH